jgi:hypothetical protein
MTDAANDCARPALSLPMSPVPRAVSDIHMHICAVAAHWALVMRKKAKKQAAASAAAPATTGAQPGIRAAGALHSSLPVLARRPVAADKQPMATASATEDAFQWPVVGSERARPAETTKNGVAVNVDAASYASGAREALHSPCDCAYVRFSS